MTPRPWGGSLWQAFRIRAGRLNALRHGHVSPQARRVCVASQENRQMKLNCRVDHPLLAVSLVLVAACGSSSPTTAAGPPVEAGPATDDASMTDSGPASVPEAGVADSGGSFVPSNVPLTTFPASAGDVSISASACVVDTDKLTVDCVSPGADGGLPYVVVAAMPNDASRIAVLAVNSLSLAPVTTLARRGPVRRIVCPRTAGNLQGSFIA